MDAIEKPTCKLTGEDGNVFAIIGRVARALKEDNQADRADEFRRKAMASHSYRSVLALCFEYVEVE